MDNPIDYQALKALYSTDRCAKALLDHLATRKKNSRQTEVDRLEAVLRQGGERCSRTEIVAVLKRLEELNCGFFVVGRRGRPSRFEWEVELVDVGRAAQGTQAPVRLLDASEPDGGLLHRDEAVTETLRHSYLIRPDFVVTLELPRDLTTKESARLAEFVRTLPFGGDDSNALADKDAA